MELSSVSAPPYLIRRKLVIRKHGLVKAVAWEIVLLALNQNCDMAQDFAKCGSRGSCPRLRDRFGYEEEFAIWDIGLEVADVELGPGNFLVLFLRESTSLLRSAEITWPCQPSCPVLTVTMICMQVVAGQSPRTRHLHGVFSPLDDSRAPGTRSPP